LKWARAWVSSSKQCRVSNWFLDHFLSVQDCFGSTLASHVASRGMRAAALCGGAHTLVTTHPTLGAALSILEKLVVVWDQQAEYMATAVTISSGTCVVQHLRQQWFLVQSATCNLALCLQQVSAASCMFLTVLRVGACMWYLCACAELACTLHSRACRCESVCECDPSTANFGCAQWCEWTHIV
jgi:hypothetical protein